MKSEENKEKDDGLILQQEESPKATSRTPGTGLDKDNDIGCSCSSVLMLYIAIIVVASFIGIDLDLHSIVLIGKILLGIFCLCKTIMFIRSMSPRERLIYLIGFSVVFLSFWVAIFFNREAVEPYDITKEKTKKYTHTHYPISMTIPIHWEIINPKFYSKEIADNIDQKRFSKKQIAIFKMMHSDKVEAILCDKTDDVIGIIVCPLTQNDIRIKDISADEFRLKLEEKLGRRTNASTFTMSTCKKMTIAGYPAIFCDSSSRRLKTHMLSYFIDTGDKVIVILMTAKDNTFLNRKVEFNSVMKTLKIGK